jgi:hypothetical protein
MENNITVPILTFIIGVILKHLWDRFIRRISIINYTMSHHYLGSSSEDPLFGSVKVLYNGNDVKNLYNIFITLSNEGGRDLTNLELNLSCDVQSAILISYASKKSSLNQLEFTEKYSKILGSDNPDLVSLKFHRRDYIIPVLNRGQQIDVLLLMTNFGGNKPEVFVGCDHTGVKMRLRKLPPQVLFGESLRLSSFIGLIFALILCYLLSISSLSLSVVAWLAFLIGAFGTFIGWGAIKIFRLVRKVLS